MSDPDRLLLMGRIGRVHGIRGEVKVIPETDDPERFGLVERLYLGDRPEAARPVAVEHVRFQYPKGRTVVLLTLVGMDTIEQAETIRGLSVFASMDDLPPLDDGEAYLHDLLGMTVVEVDDDGEPVGEPLGTLTDVFDAAHLLFEVSRPGRPPVLLPDVEEFVVALDLPGRRLLVRPPAGLFDDDAADDGSASGTA
jgi:16S rRNA processing protein RimM